jgi:hypothetical protein
MRSSMAICIAFLLGCHPTTPPHTIHIELSTPQHQTPEPNTREPQHQPSVKVQNPIGAKAGKLSKDAQQLFQYSPLGVEVALFADLSQLKTSALWDTYGSRLEEELNKEKSFTDFVKESSWNPLEQTSQAYLAVTDLTLSDPHIVIVFRAKNSKNIQKFIVKDPASKKSKYKGSVIYTETTNDMSVVFPTADLVIFGNTAEVKEALDNTSSQKDMLALLHSADSSAGMFGAAVLNKDQRDELAVEVPALANLLGLYFSLNVNKDLNLFGGAKFPTKEEATSLQLLATLALSAQEDQWKDSGFWQYVESLKIETVQTDLAFSWRLSEKNVLSLIEVFAAPQQESNVTSLSKPQHKSKLGGKKTK